MTQLQVHSFFASNSTGMGAKRASGYLPAMPEEAGQQELGNQSEISLWLKALPKTDGLFFKMLFLLSNCIGL